MLLEEESYYDVLELSPDASPQEIREAYMRLKSAYGRDSVAVYTLISREETEDMRKRIEEAYRILSDPESRRDYDQRHAILSPSGQVRPAIARSNVVSIDRVPPMDDVAEEGDLLVPPSTDFGGAAVATAALRAPLPVESPVAAQQPPPPPPAAPRAVRSPIPIPIRAGDEAPDIDRLIRSETEWAGPFLRKIREAQRISLEEMCEFTKISRAYLKSIEEEDYSRLPAPVFVRGFVSQIARKLRLPQDEVANAYISRYRKSRPDGT